MKQSILFSRRAIIFVIAFMLLFSPLELLAAQLPIIPDDSSQTDYELVSLDDVPAVMQVGEKTNVKVKLKNTGITTWYQGGDYNSRLVVCLAASRPKNRRSVFGFARVRMSENQVNPGEVATFIIKIKAPSRGGVYHEYLQPVAEGRFWFKDRGVDFRIKVLGRASTVRVGVTYAGSKENPSSAIAVASSGRYFVKDSSGNLIKICEIADICKIHFSKDLYYLYHNGVLIKKTANYLIFTPFSDAILNIASFTQLGYNGSKNRQFRGNLIVRYSTYKDSLYPAALFVINELDIEDYLKGIAEEPDRSKFTVLKTLAVVGRTYALRNIAYPKSSCFKRGFHLFNNAWSQVYKGYEYEMRAPRLSKAVKDTKGVVITYKGKIIVAAFHSRCGGRTKSLDNYPYLKSRVCAHHGHYSCSGSRLGHGAGMCMAGMRKKASVGWSVSQMIHYYYNGVKIKDLY